MYDARKYSQDPFRRHFILELGEKVYSLDDLKSLKKRLYCDTSKETKSRWELLYLSQSSIITISALIIIGIIVLLIEKYLNQKYDILRQTIIAL